jgi:hypothetical protein
MTRVTTAKLVFAGGGILVFGAGVRLENSTLRLAGIGLVAVALLLRFVKKPQ